MEGHTYIAIRTFTMRGQSYTRGDVVNVEGLAESKVGQLLNQRFVRPDGPDVNQPQQLIPAS